MMGSASSSPWQSTFQTIKSSHDQAYFVIEKAICYETENKFAEALEYYQEGLSLINRTLNVNVSCPARPDSTWDEACRMIEKLTTVREEIVARIAALEGQFATQQPPPPSYDEATSGSTTPTSLYIANLQMEVPTGPGELLYECENVRLYFISPEGIVTQTSKAETFHVICYRGDETRTDLLLLEIGDWSYPLIPGESPCFKTDYGAFILPDLHGPPNASVGIILPPETSARDYDLLQNLFYGLNEGQLSEIETQSTEIGNRISQGILTGAFYISLGLTKSAIKIGQFLTAKTPGIISYINPGPREAPVNSSVSKGVQIAQNTTSTVANVTGYVAEKVGTATQALGRYLAPHIQRQGTKLLTFTFHMSEEEASTKMEGVLNVAAGAIEGFATVYAGLETSASILGQSLSANTVKIVEHRYGTNAAEVTNGAFNTIGNVYSIRQNTKFFTPKRVVKITAKEAGKAMMRNTQTAQATTSLVYPNLNGLRELERQSAEHKMQPSTSKEMMMERGD